MRVALQFRQIRHSRDQGYILLTLILFAALIVIGAAAILPEFTFQIKRDREEEMIHRGAQYARAVRRYYKKMGRYPGTIEELKSTNNVHFLRKAYKDPVTGKDFRLLRMTDLQQLMGGAGMMMGGGMGQMAGAQGLGAGMAQQAAMAQASMAQAAMAMAQTANQTNPFASAESASSGSDEKSKPSKMRFSEGSDKLSGQTFGGGGIVGVASTSKEETVRIFNKKNHYKDWQFIYSPMMDRGGLITGPFQPMLSGMGGGSLQPGQNNIPGLQKSNQPAFGQQQQQPMQQAPQPPLEQQDEK